MTTLLDRQNRSFESLVNLRKRTDKPKVPKQNISFINKPKKSKRLPTKPATRKAKIDQPKLKSFKEKLSKRRQLKKTPTKTAKPVRQQSASYAPKKSDTITKEFSRRDTKPAYTPTFTPTRRDTKPAFVPPPTKAPITYAPMPKKDEFQSFENWYEERYGERNRAKLEKYQGKLESQFSAGMITLGVGIGGGAKFASAHETAEKVSSKIHGDVSAYESDMRNRARAEYDKEEYESHRNFEAEVDRWRKQMEFTKEQAEEQRAYLNEAQGYYHDLAGNPILDQSGQPIETEKKKRFELELNKFASDKEIRELSAILSERKFQLQIADFEREGRKLEADDIRKNMELDLKEIRMNEDIKEARLKILQTQADVLTENTGYIWQIERDEEGVPSINMVFDNEGKPYKSFKKERYETEETRKRYEAETKRMGETRAGYEWSGEEERKRYEAETKRMGETRAGYEWGGEEERKRYEAETSRMRAEYGEVGAYSKELKNAVQAYNTPGAVGSPQLEKYSKNIFQHAKNYIEGKLIVPPEILKIVFQVAIEQKVPAELIVGIMKQESGFNPDAENITPREKSFGLGQINLKAHTHITEKQAKDPEFAIDFIGKRLSGMFERYGVVKKKKEETKEDIELKEWAKEKRIKKMKEEKGEEDMQFSEEEKKLFRDF